MVKQTRSVAPRHATMKEVMGVCQSNKDGILEIKIIIGHEKGG